jgi:hypothetical protein
LWGRSRRANHSDNLAADVFLGNNVTTTALEYSTQFQFGSPTGLNATTELAINEISSKYEAGDRYKTRKSK